VVERIQALAQLRRYLVEPSDATTEFVVTGHAVSLLIVSGTACLRFFFFFLRYHPR